MKKLVALFVAAALAGCTAQLAKLGITEPDCIAVDYAVERLLRRELQKCLEADNDPFDKHCVAVTASRIIAAQCHAAVAAGDVDGVIEAEEQVEALEESVETAATTTTQPAD